MSDVVLPDPTEALDASFPPPVLHAFLGRVDATPDAVALEAEGRALTYRQLADAITGLAVQLTRLGVEPGDHVAIVGRRTPGAVAAMMAAARIGAVMVPLDASLPRLRLTDLVARAGVRVAVLVGDAALDGLDLPTLAVPAWPSPTPVAGDVPIVQRRPDDPAYVFFTSGSTGTPKGVVGTHGAFAQFMAWMAETFEIDADDRIALSRSLGFDAVLREIFLPLVVGARMVIAPDPLDPDRILDWVSRERITVLNVSPSHADVWLDAPSDLPTSLRWVFFSGERLDRGLVERWRKVVSPPGTLVNLYGPTETTFVRSFHVVEEDPDDPVPVGRPLPGTQLLVVDETGHPCPPNTPGEVLIRTVYGTRGYLEGDDRERFVPNPFTDDPDDVVYRTGDIGWYRADGNVVVSGRVDDQVKILGLRIEPREVAATLETHPSVRRCVVIAVDDDPIRLVAFVVPHGERPDPKDLLRHVRERLPGPAVPSQVLVVDRIPVTMNGKVDTEALRSRLVEDPGSATEPSDLQARLVRLSPAKRALLEARLRQRETRRDPSREAPSDLQARLARLSPAKRALLEARLRQRDHPSRSAPLSPAQERLWFLDRLYPGRAAYNIPRAHRLRGSLDVDALRRACEFLATRHEILRTRYVERDGEPTQVVDPPGPVDFAIVDLDDPAEERLDRFLAAEATHRFDLATGPVWRVRLARLAPDEYVLSVVVHHIAADGWSFPVLYRELSEAYAAYVRGEEPVFEPPALQYADYARRQRRRIAEGSYAEDLRFWTEQLRGAPDLLSLPTDRPRPPIASSRGRRLRFRCTAARMEDLTRIGREETATPFMVGLALFMAFLHRLTAAPDLVVGIPSADRSDPDTHSLIGFLVNTLAIRSTLPSPTVTFRDLLRAVRRRMVAAFDHREVPFEHVVRELSPRRSPDRTPIFQVFFQFGVDVFSSRPIFPGVETELVERVSATSKFDLTMYLRAEEGCLAGNLVYNADLFDEETMTRFVAEFEALAGELLAHPDREVELIGGDPRRPEPATETAAEHPEAPTDTVDALCRIWTEILGTDVGADDDFFALGGHSLLGIRLLSRIERRFGAQLPVSAIFEAPTPRALARLLTSATPLRETSTAASTQAPLSFSQRRLWFLDRLDPGAGNYHIPWRVRLRGPIDVEALEAAFTALVERHPVFRTRIVAEGGEPTQVVDPPEPVRISVVETTDDTLGDDLAAEARAPFDLSRDRTLRVKLFRVGPDDHVLSVVAHHIATDADSMRILRRDLTELYTARIEGRPARLDPLPTTFTEFARSQVARFSTRGEPHLRWWLETLGGDLPVLDLPADKVRPLSAARDGDTVRLDVGPDVVTALTNLAAAERCTPLMVALAAYAVLLTRSMRHEEVIVGIPATERTSPDTERLIGFFVNSLPIRLRVDPEEGFRDLVRRTRRAVLDALDHRDVPFEVIVGHLDPPRDPSRTPIFQTMFDVTRPAGERFSLPGLETVPLGVRPRRRPAKFDVRAHASLRDDGLGLAFEYRTDLFERGTIEDMARHFADLLASAVTRPDTPVELLGTEPSPTTDPRRLQAPPGTVHETFATVVRSRPDGVAVDGDDGPTTYRELDAAADRVATALAEVGVRPGDTVGVRMPRSAEIVATLLGILRLGAVYVPIDESYPEQRVETIIADARLAAIVRPGPTVEPLDPPDRPLLDPAESPAYVMYTSGSTGRPKGVVVPHRAILRLVIEPDYVSIDTDDVVAFASNTGFDAATFEIWGSLLNGARLVVLDPDTVLDPEALADALARHGVTVMFVTTALFNTVVARRPDTFAGLRTLLFGGEAVDPEAVRRCLREGPPARLVHVYGPTETTTFATWHLVTDVPGDARTVPIGRAISRTTARVVDRHLREVPRGVPGELLIGGPGVALGYLGDDQLTRDRFVGSDLGVEYRTGDLVRVRHDGAIEFLGRLDRQVKLRGFRVEPGEIESHLTSHPAVDAAVVVPRRDETGLRLVAYVAGEVTADDAIEHLRGRVPAFMIPSTVVTLPELPLNPNGKVDVAALPEPTSPVGAQDPPSDEAEETMAGLWAEILGVERVGASDDFFALGGHSLLAVKLFAAIEETFGVKAPLSTLFEAPTLSALTRRIVGEAHDRPTPSVVTIKPGGNLPPVFCFPPAGGNVMVYEPMARAFDGERPVLGIQAKGTDGVTEPLRTVEEMAAYCEEVILATRPEGPYIFVGYSLGGLVAYETARRMRAGDRDVELVVLIDARVLSQHPSGLARDLGVLRRRGLRGLGIVGRRMATRLRRLAGHLRHDPKILWYRATGRPLSPLLAGRRLTAAGSEAATRYVPDPYDGRVLYLVAGGLPARWRRDAVSSWSKLVEGPFEAVEIPGTHRGPGSVMHEPNARILARHVRRVLAERGR